MSLGDVNVLPPLEPNVNETSGDTDNSNAEISPSKMKAVYYEGPFKVSVKEIEAPTIQHPDNAIIKATTAGSLFLFPFVNSHKHSPDAD